MFYRGTKYGEYIPAEQRTETPQQQIYNIVQEIQNIDNPIIQDIKNRLIDWDKHATAGACYVEKKRKSRFYRNY